MAAITKDEEVEMTIETDIIELITDIIVTKKIEEDNIPHRLNRRTITTEVVDDFSTRNVKNKTGLTIMDQHQDTVIHHHHQGTGEITRTIIQDVL